MGGLDTDFGGGFASVFSLCEEQLEVLSSQRNPDFLRQKRKSKDGTVLGYRIIKGGKSFKVPIVESVSRMPLDTIPTALELTGALSGGLIPLNAEAMANIKIAGSVEQGLITQWRDFWAGNKRIWRALRNRLLKVACAECWRPCLRKELMRIGLVLPRK